MQPREAITTIASSNRSNSLIRLDSREIQKFHLFRKKRNVSHYERADTVSEVELNEMFLLASDPRRRVAEWIVHKHPGLAP